MTSHAQRGMALLVSLVFLLLLTLIGLSSMQNATLQEKMAGSVELAQSVVSRCRSGAAGGGKCRAAGRLFTADLQQWPSVLTATRVKVRDCRWG